MDRGKIKRVNLALHGGGAHGAFAWGVLDKLIEDGRLDIEGLSTTSAGSMNAVVYACGRLRDLGREAATRWLERTYEHIGHHSTVDLRSEYLGIPAIHQEHTHA